MAVSLLGAHEVSDLCLGKPALRALSISATVADALSALKASEENFISVWSCNHGSNGGGDACEDDVCECVGKICMVDVICYLCKEENLLSPSEALKAPVSLILPQIPGLVMHVEPFSSLLEAFDLMLEGAQNLVVPIKNSVSSRRRQHQKLSPTSPTSHNGLEFCWLTQEDVIRFILSFIGLFSPVPALSIDSLDIISSDHINVVNYHSPATLALEAISRSLVDQTSVAVVDSDGILIGELSPLMLGCCDETVSAAIATLSSGDLMAYIDCGGPPEDLLRVVKERLKEKGLEGMLEQLNNSSNSVSYLSTSSSSSYSSDEESMVTPKRSEKHHHNHSRSMSYSARMVRRAEAIVCYRKSSLVAVMIQAIAHRVSHVWVIEEDCSLIGIVTFSDMLKVFRENI